MKSNEQLWKICMNIYRELYKKAEPSADFDKLIKSGETKKDNWFMKYYLEDSKQEHIINKHIKRNKLCKRDTRAVHTKVWLGCSPSGVNQILSKQTKEE